MIKCVICKKYVPEGGQYHGICINCQETRPKEIHEYKKKAHEARLKYLEDLERMERAYNEEVRKYEEW